MSVDVIVAPGRAGDVDGDVSLVGRGLLIGPASLASFVRQDTLDIRAQRAEFKMPRTVMSSAQAASAMATGGGLHQRRSTPFTRSQPRSTNLTRRQSLAYGSTALATSATLDGPTKNATPLDEVPALFAPSALDALQAEKPTKQDIEDILRTLRAITQETSHEYGGSSTEESVSIEVPNVALGWSVTRRQQVSEQMLQLSSAVDKLLIDPSRSIGSALAYFQHPRPTANPLANLRSEFLSSREILSLIHSHATNPTDLAPALLALSKIYQNRLLEFQAMEELRLEVEPEEKFKERYVNAKKAREEKERKLREEAAAAAKSKGGWNLVRRKAHLPSVWGVSPLHGHSRRNSSNVPPGAAAAALAHSQPAPTPVPPATAQPTTPATPSKFRRLENQGSLAMYLPWNLIRRELHLFDPEIVSLTKLYWRMCFVCEDGHVNLGLTAMPTSMQHARRHQRSDSSESTLADGGCLVGMPKKTYMHLFTLIHYVLKPSYLPSYAQQVVEGDWLADVHMVDRPKDASRVLMTLPQFHLGLFNLVDTWTEGVARGEYIQFLKNMFEFITEEVVSIGGDEDELNEGAHRSAVTSDSSDGDGDESDSDSPTSRRQAAADSNASSVYHRRLKPLTIVHINNLRKLGLKAPMFRDLTLDMLHEIENKSRLATIEKETYDSNMRKLYGARYNAGLSNSDSASSLVGELRSLGHGDVDRVYRPRAFSVQQRVNIDQMRPSSPAISGTPGGHTMHKRRSSSNLSSALAGSAPPALTPIMARGGGGGGGQPAETAPFPSWASLSERKAQPTPAITASSDSTSPGAKALTERGHHRGGSSTGSGHQRRPSQQLKPSKAQEIQEGKKDALASNGVVATAASSPPVDSSAASPSGDPSTPRKSIFGSLSWRLPGASELDAETDRLMQDEFTKMKEQHDEWKRLSKEERERLRLEHEKQIKQLHDIEDESDDDDDEDADEQRARKKRRPLKRASSTNGSKSARSGHTDEKEEEIPGDKCSPFSGRSPPPTPVAGRRPSTAGSIANGGRASKRPSIKPTVPAYRGQPIPSFDSQRRRFAGETAAYIANLDRLKKDAQYHQMATGVQYSDSDPTAEESRVHELIRSEFLLPHEVGTPAFVRARMAAEAEAAGIDWHGPSPLLDGFTPDAFYSPTVGAAPDRNRSVLIARSTPSGDARDRFWRLMPQGRITNENKQTTTDLEQDMHAQLAQPLSIGLPVSSVRPPSSGSSRVRPAAACVSHDPRHFGPPSRYCDCHQCTELLMGNSPYTSGNGAKAHGDAIHTMIRAQVQNDKGIKRLQQIAQRV